MTSMLLSQIIVEIKKGSESIFTDPGFIGALVGSLLAGLVAVGILAYEVHLRKKESVLKSYGTMKVLVPKLMLLNEFEKTNLELKELIDKYPDLKTKFRKAIEKLQPQLENLYKFLEKERDTIPYEFISRYHNVVNVIEVTLVGFSHIDEAPRDEDIERVFKGIELSNKIAKEFVENTNVYLKSVEKKYKIKDFY